MTDQSTNDRRRAWVRWVVVVASVAALGAGQDSPSERTAIPQPPLQGAPWTIPANRLPKSLVEATVALYENGVADPRGCEYREFEFSARGGTSGRGFVLPERPDGSGRLAIGWDGQLYRVARVGEAADLDGDIKLLATTLDPAHSDRGWAFPPGKDGGFVGRSGLVDSSSIKLGMLLRLGRPDLAEALLLAGTKWTPNDPDKPFAGPPLTEPVMAAEWLRTAHGNLVAAHHGRDDAMALDTVRRMKRIRDRIVESKIALGLAPARKINGLPDAGDDPSFPFLTQFEPLRLDQERRALLSPRGPIPPRRGDPAARLAALIGDLDEIAESQGMSNMGVAHPENSPLVAAMVAIGPRAVEPLLAVFETDERLTRSLTSQTRREPFRQYIHPVYETAYFALIRLLPTGEFGSERPGAFQPLDLNTRRVIAMRIRHHWERTREIPVVEQCYQILLDDKKPRGMWALAASALVARESDASSVSSSPAGSKPFGESLRVGKDPSVTDLIVRRIEDCRFSFDPDIVADPALVSASSLALSLANWDEAAALPWLRELTREWRMRSDVWLALTRNGPVSREVVRSMIELTKTRFRLGDPKALDDYAVWIGSTTPDLFGFESAEPLRLLADHPDHPSIARVARWLFTSPLSPWVPLAWRVSSSYPQTENLFASPLVVLAGFREGILMGLDDKREFGKITRVGPDRIMGQYAESRMGGFGNTGVVMDQIPIDGSVSFRTCDYIASKVAEIPGAPPCELHWPEARRDEAVRATMAFLQRYGDRFVATTYGRNDDRSSTRASLAFPTLGQPATPEDVERGRAIFSLGGSSEIRLVPLPKFPQPARRVVGSVETEGLVWQAEEVRVGGVWERYFGFVGPHAIERVAASEIVFGERFSDWGVLTGGLDARVEPTRPTGFAFEPGQPIELSLRIRNRLGIDRSSPTEFVRVGPDGKVSLRRGVKLALAYEPTPALSVPRFDFRYRMKNVPALRSSSFDPGDASRTLTPLESFEAVRMNVNDWFDTSRPGRYQLIVKFGADSGCGEGSTQGADFRIGNDE